MMMMMMIHHHIIAYELLVALPPGTIPHSCKTFPRAGGASDAENGEMLNFANDLAHAAAWANIVTRDFISMQANKQTKKRT